MFIILNVSKNENVIAIIIKDIRLVTALRLLARAISKSSSHSWRVLCSWLSNRRFYSMWESLSTKAISTMTLTLNQILLKAGAIPCNEFLSHDSFSKIYFCLVTLGLSLVYGLWTAVIYIRSPVVRLRQGDIMRITEEYIQIWKSTILHMLFK